MKFFFPDSQDQIDPGFDFVTEERDPFRVRQRDDLYAHEVLTPTPFDGLLVSKAIVDGDAKGGTGKYTSAQRHRLYSEGAEAFFRLNRGPEPLRIMGDCGAFSYWKEPTPPYEVDDVVGFYNGCGFDYGISVDHIIFDNEPDVSPDDPRLGKWLERQEITLDLAADFWRRCLARDVDFTPVGVAQGWSPSSYTQAVMALQQMGYRRIAIGGMALAKTYKIIDTLRAVDDIRGPDTQLHLLGISRCDDIPAFARYGVTSFDSTSPFQQAFKDERNNYHTLHGAYVAIRVPQVDGNPELRDGIRSGEINQNQAIKLERAALHLLRRYDRDEVHIDPVLEALSDYTALCRKRDRTEQYRRTLTDRPWRQCPCALCQELKIEIVLFRGTDRNKRRGFHNLYVFEQRMRDQLGKDET